MPRHNDPEHLATLLREVDPGTPKLSIFESVYSMDGDFAPIAELCNVADRHGAMTRKAPALLDPSSNWGKVRATSPVVRWPPP